MTSFMESLRLLHLHNDVHACVCLHIMCHCEYVKLCIDSIIKWWILGCGEQITAFVPVYHVSLNFLFQNVCLHGNR